MLARRDQENLVHAQQTAAAAKPLNQGVRGLAPKTPGNRGNRNDENAVTVAKKDANALVTPAPNQTRVALGAKTTNAKARAFATPGPLAGGQGLTKTQRRSGSTKKPKLKVHHQFDATPAETGAAQASDEEPEIETFPPPIKELPDGPDEYEFGPTKTFPQFQGANMSRGWRSFYNDQVGPDGLTRYERRGKELEEAIDRHVDEEMQRDLDAGLARLDGDLDSLKLDENQKRRGAARSASVAHSRTASSTRSVSSSTSSRKTLLTQPSSAKQRDAANALAARSKPRFAQPTASTRAKDSIPETGLPASPAAKATIGYSRGRQVSSSIREAKAREASRASSETPPQGNALAREQLLLDQLLQASDTSGGLTDNFWEEHGDDKDWFQEQLEADRDFRLEMPKND